MHIRGIKSGAVLQRNKDNVCDITVYCDQPITEITVSDSFSNISFEEVSEGKYHITGIRAGGPYEVIINKEEFHDIYVGDVWILAGQSNMQGIGRMVDISRNSNQSIRALYVTNEWGMANDPLHELGKSHYKVHTVTFGKGLDKVTIRGAGPGVSFGEKMYSLTHVPQGLIASSHGGKNLFKDWNPKLLDKGEYSLYGATYERFLDTGSNIAGIFWYQGCSDANPQMADSYSENMVKLVEAFRRDFQEDIPFVQVQIACCTWKRDEHPWMADCWSSTREQQRLLDDKISNFDTVHTVAYRLSDGIHLSGKSHETVGKDAAEAMFCLKYGKLYGCLPGIELGEIEVYEDEADRNMCTIILNYENVHGQLDGGPRPLGFDISVSPERAERFGIIDIETDGNRVILTADFSKEKALNRYLWYNYGHWPQCNIVDSAGRSLPGMGPVRIGAAVK